MKLQLSVKEGKCSCLFCEFIEFWTFKLSSFGPCHSLVGGVMQSCQWMVSCWGGSSKWHDVSAKHCSVAVLSDSLWPHELQYNRLLGPSLSPWVCSNTCPLSQWCHPAISSSVVPFSSCLQCFPASGCFPMSPLYIRWPKSWSFSFSISPSNEYSRLISFRTHWFNYQITDLLKGSLVDLTQLQCAWSEPLLSCLDVFVDGELPIPTGSQVCEHNPVSLDLSD